MIIDIEKTLNRLADREKICRSSIETILAKYGKEAKVGKRILRKAIDDRGILHFRTFFAEALSWPDSLTKYLERRAEQILWGTKYSRRPFSERTEIIRRMHVAVVLAYVEEIKKP